MHRCLTINIFLFIIKNKWKAQGIYLVNFIVKAFIFDRNGTFEKERKKVCNLFTIWYVGTVISTNEITDQ